MKIKDATKACNTNYFIKKIYHRCPAESCHFQNLIQLNKNKNGNSADGKCLSNRNFFNKNIF